MNKLSINVGSKTVQAAPRIVGAFTEEQASALSGLSVHQLRYWNKSGFFRPELGEPDAHGAYARAYTFRNVAGLRVLGKLRREHGVSLQHLRKVAERLEQMDQDLWNEQTLYIRDRQVYFANEIGGFRNAVSGEDTLPEIPLRRVIGQAAEEVERMRKRSEADIGRISAARHVARNRSVIAGTRIPVGAISEFYEAGYSVRQIVAEYPSLTQADVRAALRHCGIQAA